MEVAKDPSTKIDSDSLNVCLIVLDLTKSTHPALAPSFSTRVFPTAVFGDKILIPVLHQSCRAFTTITLCPLILATYWVLFLNPSFLLPVIFTPPLFFFLLLLLFPPTMASRTLSSSIKWTIVFIFG